MKTLFRSLTRNVAAALCLACASGPLFAANGQPFEDLQQQIDELKAQIAGLGGIGPYEVSVDCDTGDSINAALQDAPPVTTVLRIFINGTCNETVRADRSNFWIIGETPGSEIIGSNGPAFTNGGQDRTFLMNTNVSATGSFSNIFCSNGSLAVMNTNSSRPYGDGTNLNGVGNCAIFLRDGEFTGGAFGLIISHDSNAQIIGTRVADASSLGIIINNNSNATLGLSQISGLPTIIEHNGSGGAIDGLGSLIV